jgi:hypothetical protein
MKQGLRVAGPALALALTAPSLATSQELILPTPESTVTPDSKQMVLTWTDVAENAGRAVTNVTFDFDLAPADSDSVSIITLEGDYVGLCDYRLSLAKIPLDPDFDQHVELVYRIATNTTGTGAPVAQDTLHLFQPDTPETLRVDIAGNVTLRASSNVDPAAPLGGVPVTVSGLYAGKVKRTEYVARALNSVTSLSDTLLVQVRGPVRAPPQFVLVDTLLVTQPDSAYAIMEGMLLSFGSGSATAGDSTTWAAHYLFPATGQVTADLEAFEGYHAWRAQLPNLNEFFLLGEIRQCESKSEFVFPHPDPTNVLNETDLTLTYDDTTGVFTVLDRDIHNDFPYRYAVSTFDRGFLGNVEDSTFDGPLDRSDIFYPAPTERSEERNVFVVPNPYKARTEFEQGGPKVVFVNLPNPCTIRVFTTAADHIATLQHSYPGEARSTSETSASWDLTTDRQQAIVPGIYIYYVESASFQQTGKMIVIR